MIEFEDVHRYYGARPAVIGLSFGIEHGECVGLLGLNGAGKSTTLRMLAGVSLPTRGSVRIDGEVLGPASHALRARIGYLPETSPLYPEMSVARFLVFVARLRGLGSAAARAGTERVLATCGLERVRDEPMGTLSHGYQRRVGIAQAIVHGPRVVVLDEPGQGLDPAQNLAMRALVRGLSPAHTVVLSTHLLPDIRACASRILLLHEGRLLAEGSELSLARRFSAAEEGSVLALVRAAPSVVAEVVGRIEGAELGSIHEQTDGLLVEVNGSRDLRAELSRALVGAGCELLELRRTHHGLEQLFVTLGKERG